MAEIVSEQAEEDHAAGRGQARVGRPAPPAGIRRLLKLPLVERLPRQNAQREEGQQQVMQGLEGGVFLPETEVGKGRQQQTQSEDDDRSAQDLANDISFRVAPLDAFAEGQRDGDADDEEKEGEDPVGDRAAVPIGMQQGRVDVRLVARVVYQDHSGHGQSAKDIEGEQALVRLHGDRWFFSTPNLEKDYGKRRF